jgi:glycosyltransferase involved in cell wall biosynthesis
MMNAKALCLNMIVKNEMANLERCLGAVAEHIACWVIGDTGSSDGTQDFIRAFFAARGLPGELHSFPFVNFEQARNEARNRAYASPMVYDYLLLTDADMELVVEDPEFRTRLGAPCYDLLQRSGVSYWNARIVHRNADARYHGVTHEYLSVPGGGRQLHGVWYKDHATGANRVAKFERDIRLLLGGLEQEPKNDRYWFYLATMVPALQSNVPTLPQCPTVQLNFETWPFLDHANAGRNLESRNRRRPARLEEAKRGVGRLLAG